MGDYNPNENNDGVQQGNSNPNPDQSQYQQPGYQQPPSNQQYQQPGYNGQPQYQQSQYNGQSQYQQPGYQQPGQGQYQQPYSQYQPQPRKNNGMSIASMVCGIVSLLISCCLWYIALPLAIVGIVLGILSIKNKYDGRGMAIAGIICCSITILLALIIIISCAALGTEFWENLYNEYNLDEYYNY